MLIKEKLQSVGQRGTLTLIAILQIVTAPRCNCILEEPLEHSRCVVDGLLYSVIHLLPETGTLLIKVGRTTFRFLRISFGSRLMATVVPMCRQ